MNEKACIFYIFNIFFYDRKKTNGKNLIWDNMNMKINIELIYLSPNPCSPKPFFLIRNIRTKIEAKYYFKEGIINL